jgi:hypothetical protein
MSSKEKHGKGKIKKVIKEFKSGELHSGSKNGPIISDKKQAMAVAMSEAGLKKKK